jgi:hypothetical protein
VDEWVTVPRSSVEPKPRPGTRLFVAPGFFDWLFLRGGGAVIRREIWYKPYEAWTHAEGLLASDATQYQRADAVGTLKRCMFARAKTLDQIYEFSSAPVPNIPQAMLDRLEFFGLVRPSMLRRLNDIRNLIEHEEESPPPVDVCRDLLDVIWYFLRSTDPYRQILDMMTAYPDDSYDSDEGSTYWLEIETGPRYEWEIKVNGWLPASVLLDEPSSNSLVIECERFVRNKDADHLWSGVRPGERLFPRNRPTDPHDCFVGGSVIGNPSAVARLAHRYFMAED